MYSYVFIAIVRVLTFWIQVSEFYHKTTKNPFNNQMFGTCKIITMMSISERAVGLTRLLRLHFKKPY